MRVLHVISGIDPTHGGTATALAGLVKAQAAEGLDVTVLSTHRQTPGEATADELRAAGVRVTLLPGHGQLSRHPQLRQITDEHVAGADVVHVHALFEEIQHLAGRAARAAHKPYFVRPAGMLCPWSFSAHGRWRKQLYMLWRLRRNLERATAIHYTSDIERDLTVGLHHLTAPSLVVPNGVDLDEFATLPPRSTFRARYPQIGDRMMLLFLSRLSEQKGLDILIPAFAEGGPRDAMLIIAGPDYGTLDLAKRLANERGVQDRVIFTGMLKGADRIAAYADADLFVLPSRHENFGNVVVESLAAGVPVAISDQVYIHPFISRAGVGGVSPLEVKSYAELLRHWTADAPLRSSAASRARDFVFEHFDWRQIARQWAQIYERAVQGAALDSPAPVGAVVVDDA